MIMPSETLTMVLHNLSQRELTKIAGTCRFLLWHVFDLNHWIEERWLQLREELEESSKRIKRIPLENLRVII